MNDCRPLGEELTLLAENALSEDEAASLRAHLEGCQKCRLEWERTRHLQVWLEDPELFAPPLHGWDTLPEVVSGRVRARHSPTPVLSFAWLRPRWAAGIAAVLLAGLFAVWRIPGGLRPRIPPVAQRAAGNAGFIKQIHAAYAKEATAQYLQECQDLLLNIVRAEKSCLGRGLDLSIEIARARSLLQTKRLLDTDLRTPEISHAKPLCDDLETFLSALSTTQECESPERMQTLEQIIQKEHLLLRIRFLEADLS